MTGGFSEPCSNAGRLLRLESGGARHHGICSNLIKVARPHSRRLDVAPLAAPVQAVSEAASGMFQSREVLICGLLLWGSARAAPPGPAALKTTTAGRQLTGRFLHITGTRASLPAMPASAGHQLTACHRLSSGPLLQDILEHRSRRCLPPRTWPRGHIRRRDVRLRLALLAHQPDVPVDQRQYQGQHRLCHLDGRLGTARQRRENSPNTTAGHTPE